jgi:hypothetical protein
MTDAQLQGLGAQACNMAKLDLERGTFNFLLASYHEADDRQLHRMTKIEELILQRLGEDWLNSGRKKDMGFGLLRTCVTVLPPDAMIFASVTNQFGPTEKFDELTPTEQHELLHSAHDRHHEAVAEGLLYVRDVLTVIVQTPERVCMYLQPIEHGQPVGQGKCEFFDQEGFGGRMKMFGEDKTPYATT